MKYSIVINQKQIVGLNKEIPDKKYKLDLGDAALLNYLSEFSVSPKIKTVMEQGKVYYWFSYTKIIEDMPLLGVSSKRSISRMFDKLIMAGLLQRHKDNRANASALFCFGDKYNEIISDESSKDKKDEPMTDLSNPIDKNVQPPMTDLSNPIDKNVQPPMTDLSNNTCINDNVLDSCINDNNTDHAQNLKNFDASFKKTESSCKNAIEPQPLENEADNKGSLGARGGTKKQKPQKDPDNTAKFNGIKSIFLEHYMKTKGLEYYFSAKDAGSVSQLVRKLESHIRNHNGTETADRDEVCNTFSVMLDRIKDEWIINNLSLPLINSKYNEIIASINGKSSSKLKKGDVDFAEIGKLIYGDNGDGIGLVELDLFGKKRRKRQQEYNDSLSRNVG